LLYMQTILWLIEKRGLSKDIDDMIAPVSTLFRLSGMDRYKELVKFYDSYGTYGTEDDDD